VLGDPTRWEAFRRHEPSYSDAPAVLVSGSLHQRVRSGEEVSPRLKANSTSPEDGISFGKDDGTVAQRGHHWPSARFMTIRKLGVDPDAHNDFIYEADDSAGLKTPVLSSMAHNPRDEVNSRPLARIHSIDRSETA